MSIVLTPAGKELLNQQTKKLETRFLSLTQKLPFDKAQVTKLNEKVFWTWRAEERKELANTSLLNLLHQFSIRKENYIHCALTYLKTDIKTLTRNAAALLHYDARLTTETALKILQTWDCKPHFKITNSEPNKELRDYLWLQILEHVSHQDRLLWPPKLEPEQIWCIDIGLVLPSSKLKACTYHHPYHPIVSNNPELYPIIADLLHKRDQRLIEQLPKSILSRDPKDQQCFFLETGDLYKSPKSKKQAHCNPNYLICSNYQPLFKYFEQQLQKIISEYAFGQQHLLQLRKAEPEKILNLDSHRMCVRPPKDFKVDETRRLASKNEAKLKYFVTQVNPDTVVKPKTKSRPRKEKIPQDIRIKVWEKYNPSMQGHCFVCKDDLHFRNFHGGHIQAEAKGGEISLDNLVPICQQCNLVMGTTHLFQFVLQGRLAYLEDNEPLRQLVKSKGPPELKQHL